jgi:hypothetical protein
MVFDRILTAKHSIANRCFAKDGDVLIFLPRKTVPLKLNVKHHFISVQNPSLKSKYGWVNIVQPFSVEDFVRTHLRDRQDQVHTSAVKTMLTAISNLPEATPVAIHYVQRGIEQKRMDISIHKVFFYTDKKDK